MYKAKIAIVEDEQPIQQLFLDILEDKEKFQVAVFASGKELQENFAQFKPNVVLLDVLLPDMDGYKVCESIRQMSGGDRTSIIFVSGKDSQEDRISGYEAGGDDYITKPFKAEELLAKINRMVSYQQNFQQLTEQHQYAQKVAFNAMGEASQYGVVLQFIKSLFNCNKYADLAQIIFTSIHQLNLQCCIQIREDERHYNFKYDKSPFSPLEVNLFNVLHNQGRIYDFKQRTIYNDQHISILIIRMPMENPEQYGRIKDIVAAILEASESCVRDIQKRKLLASAMEDARLIVKTVEGKFNHYGKVTIDIIDKFLIEMQSGMDSLALSEDQENYFLNMCEKRMENLVNLYVEGQEIDRYFDSLLTKLDAAINER